MRRYAVLVLFLTLVGVAGCSGARQSIPAPASPQAGIVAEPFPIIDTTVRIEVPLSAGAAGSATIGVNSSTVHSFDISFGSPGCGGSNPLVCVETVTAPTGVDVFHFKTFSGPGGTGSVLASGDVLQAISSTSAAVNVTLGGVLDSLKLGIRKTNPFECSPAIDIELVHMGMDASGNTIIGPYGTSVFFSDSDTSGDTSLSATAVSSSSPLVSVHYNGFPLRRATFTATASGVTKTTPAVLLPLQMLYVPDNVSTLLTPQIAVFQSNADGDVAPLRKITGLSSYAIGARVDGVCHLHVLENGRIEIVDAGANGGVTPIRSITDFTRLTNPHELFVDPLGRDWVSNEATTTSAARIVEYAPDANGSPAPIRDIEGSNTHIDGQAVAVGSDGTIYSVLGTCCTNNLVVFPSTANGNAAPTRTADLSIKASRTEWYKQKLFILDGRGALDVYPDSVSGTATPLATISGSNTLLTNVVGLAVSRSGAMFVGQNGNASIPASIIVFPNGANGNVNPRSVMTGSATQLFPFLPGNLNVGF